VKTKSSVPGSAQLFADTHPVVPPAGVHIANIDGASRGNPGPASYAVVLRVAEYFALLAALDYATTHNIAALRIRSDSELLVRQMQGRYKVKSADLKPLHERAAKLARQLQYFAIEHVRRELNRDADALANVALDSAAAPKFEDRKTRVEPSQLTHKAALSQAEATADPRQYPSRSIRARFVRGTFVLAEPVNLPEGSEVILSVRIPHKQ
jgi:ribonuclease HI